jgi:hypothetical protein
MGTVSSSNGLLSVIVPYRRRRKNLEGFLSAMPTFLAGREWELIIAEQMDGHAFNQGLLYNVGFLYSQGTSVCFHDVDMLPVTADYSHPAIPTSLITKCNLYDDSIPYKTYFGGVNIFPRECFKKVNGYSNSYLVWGASDDDMWIRCATAGWTPARREGTFFHQDHPRDECRGGLTHNHRWLDLFATKHPELQWMDGLNSLKFTVQSENRNGNITVLAIDYDEAEIRSCVSRYLRI